MQIDFLKEMTPVFYNQHGIKAFSRSADFPLHWHDRIELMYLLEGELRLKIDKKEYTAHAGELIILTPHTLHSGDRVTPSTYFATLMFEPSLFSCGIPAVKNFMDALLQKQIRLTPVTTDPDIINLFLKIHQEQSEQGDIATLRITSHIYELLALLRERCLLDMQVQFSAKSTFSEIITYIQENYQEPLTSSFLCKKFGYSQNYFSRRFIAETGMPPTAFIRTVRLENAAEMLRETDMTISSIALACGFTSTKYFTHCFRELYNITPGQFRNTNNE